MPTINNKIATLAASVSLGFGSARDIGKDTEFLRSNTAPASSLITTAKEEKELTPGQELRRKHEEARKELAKKQLEETNSLRDKVNSITEAAKKIDQELTLKARASALTPADLDKFLKAANLDDKITLKYLQTNIGKEVKAAMLETKDISPEQKKELISKLYSKSDLDAAQRVKDKFDALLADGADIKKGIKDLDGSWQPSSPSIVAALLKHHLGLEDSPLKLLKKVYSTGENSNVIGADPNTQRSYRKLENSFQTN